MARDQSSVPGPAAPSALMVELLTWVAARPRTYGETMEAWRTSCPRVPVWEDAITSEFIEVRPSDDGGVSASTVRITPLGRVVLAGRT